MVNLNRSGKKWSERPNGKMFVAVWKMLIERKNFFNSDYTIEPYYACTCTVQSLQTIRTKAVSRIKEWIYSVVLIIFFILTSGWEKHLKETRTMVNKIWVVNSLLLCNVKNIILISMHMILVSNGFVLYYNCIYSNSNPLAAKMSLMAVI